MFTAGFNLIREKGQAFRVNWELKIRIDYQLNNIWIKGIKLFIPENSIGNSVLRSKSPAGFILPQILEISFEDYFLPKVHPQIHFIQVSQNCIYSGFTKKRNDLKYTTLGLEPVSIDHYNKAGSSIKRPTQN